MWDDTFDIHSVQNLRAANPTWFGCGAIAKIHDIAKNLAGRGVKSALIVTGRGAYRTTGAWDQVEAALRAAGIRFVLFDQVTPNPTAPQVDAAVKLGRNAQARAVIAIGGGSPIDAGKSAAILLEYPNENAGTLYEYKFAPTKAVPVVAINLTHGTGTECDRFAVVTIPGKEYKPAIAYDCIYPFWAIDDPALMTGLSEKQTRYVSIDAVNHVIEAATSKVANPFSLTLAGETIRLVAKYLPDALRDPKDLRARYFLLYASWSAGVGFDNGMLHYTHALEHPLSAVKPDLAHGLGLAMLLPAVVENIYAALPERLSGLLEPLVPGLPPKALAARRAAEGVERWLHSVGVTEKLSDVGFTAKDVDKLVKLTFETPSLPLLLSLAPTMANETAVRRIFETSLTPLCQAE